MSNKRLDVQLSTFLRYLIYLVKNDTWYKLLKKSKPVSPVTATKILNYGKQAGIISEAKIKTEGNKKVKVFVLNTGEYEIKLKDFEGTLYITKENEHVVIGVYKKIKI